MRFTLREVSLSRERNFCFTVCRYVYSVKHARGKEIFDLGLWLDVLGFLNFIILKNVLITKTLRSR